MLDNPPLNRGTELTGQEREQLGMVCLLPDADEDIDRQIKRVLDHFVANREAGESFRQYVLRNKVETVRALTAEFAKPADLFPEIYQDWGDDTAFSLQLGRGECAA